MGWGGVKTSRTEQSISHGLSRHLSQVVSLALLQEGSLEGEKTVCLNSQEDH